MIKDIIIIDVVNKPYKKMEGYLRFLKIDPQRVAISINKENSTYRQIIWKSILIDGHRVKKIILLKSVNLFLYIGSAADDMTIVYNEDFSKFILSNSISLDDKQIKADGIPTRVKVVQKNNTEKINDLLDKIKISGVASLTFAQKNLLDDLSKKIK